MFDNVKQPEEVVANGPDKHPRNVSAGHPRASARRVVGQPERRVRQPPSEVRLVGEQLEDIVRREAHYESGPDSSMVASISL